MSQPANTDRYTQIVITYQLADFLLMSRAKNDLVDHFIRATSNYGIGYDTMSILSLAGVTETKLFEYCTHSCLCLTMKSGKEPTGLNEQLKDHPEVLYAVIKALHEWVVKPWGKPTIKDRCRYHDHDDGSQCVVLNVWVNTSCRSSTLHDWVKLEVIASKLDMGASSKEWKMGLIYYKG